MFDFDPRDSADERDCDREGIYDSRWGEDARERDERERELDPRDRDPRDPFVHRLDLPHGLERELVQDERERLCELNGEDSRSDDAWADAHRRLDATRRLYAQHTQGQAFGRPMVGNPSKYLLTNFALCGACRGSLKVLSRSHGHGRKLFYGCAGYHDRGRTVCRNNADVPMADANEIVIEALLDDVLDPQMHTEAVDEALRVLQGDGQDDRATRLEAEIATVEAERARLVSAIAFGGRLDGLLQGLQARETRRAALEAERASLRSHKPPRASDAARLRAELVDIAASWRQVLADDPTHARPIVSGLLKGRVSYTPIARGRWELRGEGTLAGLFARAFSISDGVPNVVQLEPDHSVAAPNR